MITEQKKGSLSVHTENIFPIIKKFLYSDHEIFLRELVSNAVDASQKIKRLSSLGETNSEVNELKVTVTIDKENKTLTVSDNGIGMTTQEVEKYINQIAFSGATEFVEKYKNADDAKQIIGHFGLGFYSAFMVARKVELITRSHQENEAANAVHWICDGSTTYTMETTTRTERGTDVILHLAEDSEEFLESYRVSGILKKYCKFLPIAIEFEGSQINNPNPIWASSPSSLTEEDYKNFYKELYPYSEEPLFWIHLNVDYPFNLTGILYFPKIKQDLSYSKDRIHLYSRQVFITDEVKDIVPEFLMLLHGVIDSPDIPLNVSRSYLQADGNVKKINSYITRKVAEKLQEIAKNDREGYEKKWESIGVFVRYGMITDDKFQEKAPSFALYKSVITNQYFTFDEYKEKVAPTQTNKNESVVFLYTSDAEKQHSFIQRAEKAGYDVILMDGVLDSHFINKIETGSQKVSFKRVDADIVEKLIEKEEKREVLLSEEQKTKIKEVFDKAKHDKMSEVQIEALSPEEMPVVIVLPEIFRRIREMASTGGVASGLGGMRLPENVNVVVNGNHRLIHKIADTTNEEEQIRLTKQVYDLALLAQNMLVGEALTKFVERSVSLIQE